MFVQVTVMICKGEVQNGDVKREVIVAVFLVLQSFQFIR